MVVFKSTCAKLLAIVEDLPRKILVVFCYWICGEAYCEAYSNINTVAVLYVTLNDL